VQSKFNSADLSMTNDNTKKKNNNSNNYHCSSIYYSSLGLIKYPFYYFQRREIPIYIHVNGTSHLQVKHAGAAWELSAGVCAVFNSRHRCDGDCKHPPPSPGGGGGPPPPPPTPPAMLAWMRWQLNKKSRLRSTLGG
jgi:hypothetical protein